MVLAAEIVTAATKPLQQRMTFLGGGSQSRGHGRPQKNSWKLTRTE
jgi:hypothetical protein